MTAYRLLAVLVCIGISLGLTAAPGYGYALIIGSGTSVSIQGGGLDLSCQDILVETGGTLDLGDGTIQNAGRIVVQPGALFLKEMGQIMTCSGWLPGIFLLLLE